MIRIAAKIKIIQVTTKLENTKKEMEDSDGRRYHA